MTQVKFGYEPQLDGLRAFAVGGVVLFHLGLSPVGGGFTGVDVFFVLSGYLITALIRPAFESRQFSFVDFYVRRGRRLLPALFVTILVTAIFAVLLLSPDHLRSFARSASHAIVSLANVNFWLESGYFDSDKYTKPLLHTWSLGVEEQFYLMWPLLLMSVVMLFRGNRLGQALVLGGFTLISFAVALFFVERFPSAAFYLSPFRAWQFAAGGLLALTLHGSSGRMTLPAPVGVGATLLGLSGVVASFLYVTPQGYPDLQALLPTLGTLLVILGGANPVSNLVLSNGVMRWFGRTSYALYLTHWPIIVFIRYYNNAPLDGAGMVLAGALSVLTAWLLHRYVETRFRKPWTQSSSEERFAVPAALGAVAAVLILLSSYPWSQSGWTWRLSSESRLMIDEMARTDAIDCVQRPIGDGLGRHCFFGRQGRFPNAVVIGDSHAAALANGLEERLAESGMTGVRFIQNGALPFVGVQTYDDQTGRAQGFDRFYNWTSQRNVDLVVIHSRFALHWLSQRPDGEPGRRKYVGVFGEPAPETLEASRDNFRQGLAQTMLRAGDLPGQVVLVGALPYQGVDLRQCITRPTLIMSVDHALRTCGGFSRQDALDRTREVNALLRTAAQEAGLIFIDPTEILCPEGQAVCLRVQEGKLLFRDTNHLTDYGASLLSDAIWEAVGP